jgi:4-amino-4-deoxy-L-arabinose transferase-like glycosyltransferase
LLLCGLIALPWYILVALQTRLEFLADFLLIHNLGRAVNALEDHSGPPWYYLAVLAIGLAPWSAFLGSAMWYGARQAFGKVRRTSLSVQAANAQECPSHLASTDAYRFLWCWIVVYLLLFTVAATKLPNYILPVFPPCALLIADFLERWRGGAVVPPAWLQPISVSMLALIGLVTVIGLLILGGAIPASLPHGRVYPGLERWSVLGVIPIIGAAVAAWCLYRQRRTAFVTTTCVVALCFLGPLAAGGSAALNPFRAPRPLVEQSAALQRDQEIRIGAFELEFLPSLNFYVQRNVQHLQCAEEAIEFLRQPLTVFLFLPRSEWQQLAPRVSAPCRIVGSNREMYRAGEVIVVANR